MGGLNFYGFGWKDSLQPVKTVASFFCPNCRSVQNIAVMEVSSKVTVLWVPTVTFSTKHAVGCEKCKLAHKIDESQAKGLLEGRLTVRTFNSNGVTIS